VRFGGLPAKVPDNLLDTLRLQEDQRMEEVISEDFQVGDLVEVMDGVMAGYEGVFQERVSSKRAAILLNIVDHYTTVQVSIDGLEKTGCSNVILVSDQERE